MKRNVLDLENIKNFVDSTYNSFGSSLVTKVKGKYGPFNRDLGYCFKMETIDPKTKFTTNSIYRIVTSTTGYSETDFRVLMHEYGHIYFGHLDSIHEELDTIICNLLRDHRGDIIDKVNKECGIDYGETLVDKIIDDKRLNHSLHNIAMDLEINSKILSDEDIEEMEKDVLEALNREHFAALDKMVDAGEKTKEDCEKEKEKIRNESQIKLCLPSRLEIAKGVPFPNELTYPEYLMLMIKHLDQFVKMLTSIKMGKGGATSGITSDDVNDALGGNSDGSGLDSLMDQTIGGTNPNNSDEKVDSPYEGARDESEFDQNEDEDENPGDHGSNSRNSADKKRELGEIRSKGGVGCGSSSSRATRVVNQNVDPLVMGIEEVLTNFSSKVIKVSTKKDPLYVFNRGINRSVISPTIRRKVAISTEPTIVFLIDISGSMDTALVDRILKTISYKMGKLNRGLKYNIITWNTNLGDHLRNLDPKKPIPKISTCGGTRMAAGIKYFKEHYSQDAIMILISDFEDYLEEWHNIEKDMPGYSLYGFNYGRKYNQEFKYLKVRECYH